MPWVTRKKKAWFESEIDHLKSDLNVANQENQRLIDMFADPQVMSVEVDKRVAEIRLKPREEMMRVLFGILSHAIGDAKNYVETGFGPDPETGETYVVTVRRYSGKSPSHIHKEQIDKLRLERNEAEQAYSDLVHWCEAMLQAYDQHQKPFGGVGSILALAIECIRDSVHPNPGP